LCTTLKHLYEPDSNPLAINDGNNPANLLTMDQQIENLVEWTQCSDWELAKGNRPLLNIDTTVGTAKLCPIHDHFLIENDDGNGIIHYPSLPVSFCGICKDGGFFTDSSYFCSTSTTLLPNPSWSPSNENDFFLGSESFTVCPEAARDTSTLLEAVHLQGPSLASHLPCEISLQGDGTIGEYIN
jgi:hypothetical protein